MELETVSKPFHVGMKLRKHTITEADVMLGLTLDYMMEHRNPPNDEHKWFKMTMKGQNRSEYLYDDLHGSSRW